MNIRRLLLTKKRELVLYTKRFYPAGNYTWLVPEGCTEVDVFLVGGGGSGLGYNSAGGSGGGGGYTKTFKSSTDGWRDGEAISVTPGETINIIVGEGGSAGPGGYSQFMNTSYRASGGEYGGHDANGGSGGSYKSDGGSDGGSPRYGGTGQGHTTRDFGESSGKRNAGGGFVYVYGNSYKPGESDYTEGTGGGVGNYAKGGGGYGGGGSGHSMAPSQGTTGGDGTVLIRYYAYKQ